MATATETITLKDGGPVEEITFPFVPGVVLLKGKNDIGKSQALEAISRWAGGDGHVTPRDGTKRGEIEGLEVRVTFGASRTSRTGELEAQSLEGRFSIDDLVDPKIKDAEAADKHRIKALLQLTGARADLDAFAKALFPEGGREELDYYLDGQSLATDDLVELAGKIKRALEERSRREAGSADRAEIQAAACKQQTTGVNLEAEIDTTKLNAELEAAAGGKSKLDEQVRAARQARSDAEAARKSLAEAGQQAESSQEAQAALDAARVRRAETITAADAAKAEVKRIEDELAAVKARLEAQIETAKARQVAALVAKSAADDAVTAAENAVKAIEQNKKLTSGWQAAIDAVAGVTEPTAEAVAQAAQRVTAARQSIEHAALVRQARAKADEADEHTETAKNHRKAATTLREAAKATDDVLSNAVASDNLFVYGGRLVTKCERGIVPYGERSQGTRWTIALDEAVRCIREIGAEGRAVIVACQEAWESLDPDNRLRIRQHCIDRNVCLYTAQSARGKLRAEVFQPEQAT